MHPLPGFVYLKPFVRAIRGLFSEADLQALEASLVEQPEQGDVIAGTGGVRKMRVALPSRGKSGGARVIYYYRGAVGRIYLITAFAKNVQANISAAEKHEMKQITAALDRET